MREPLLRAADVTGQLAGVQHLAVHRPDGDDVANLAARHRGQRFVQQRHPGVDLTGRHQLQPPLAHRVEDDVGGAAALRDPDRGGQMPVSRGRVRCDDGQGQLDPSPLRTVPGGGDQTDRPPHPAARSRRVAVHRPVQESDDPRAGGRANVLASLPVGGEGLLTVDDRPGVVTQ